MGTPTPRPPPVRSRWTMFQAATFTAASPDIIWAWSDVKKHKTPVPDLPNLAVELHVTEQWAQGRHLRGHFVGLWHCPTGSSDTGPADGSVNVLVQLCKSNCLSLGISFMPLKLCWKTHLLVNFLAMARIDVPSWWSWTTWKSSVRSRYLLMLPIVALGIAKCQTAEGRKQSMVSIPVLGLSHCCAVVVILRQNSWLSVTELTGSMSHTSHWLHAVLLWKYPLHSFQQCVCQINQITIFVKLEVEDLSLNQTF